MQTMGQTGWDDKGITGGEMSGLAFLTMDYFSTGDKAELEIAVVMRLMGKAAFFNQVDVIVPFL